MTSSRPRARPTYGTPTSSSTPRSPAGARARRRRTRGHDARRPRRRPGLDPHVWLDPVRFSAIAAAIGAGEAGERARDFVARLAALDREFRSGLERCERREIVTAHAAFGRLAARYDLRQISLAGLSPEAEPTPRELERLVEAVRATGATTVFTEPLVSPRVADTVARETGGRTAVLDPIEGLTEEQVARGDDYFSVMRRNLATLRVALGCR